MWLEKALVSPCNPSVYYNWSQKSNIVLHEHRLKDIRFKQCNNFCYRIIEAITSKMSSGSNGAFKIPRSVNMCCKSSWIVYWKNQRPSKRPKPLGKFC